MPSSLCLALDVGATKLGAALVDRQGDARYVAESRTPEGNDPEVVFSEVTKLLDGVLGSDACALTRRDVDRLRKLLEHARRRPGEGQP